MFNRQPYNRGKFNVQTAQSIGNNGLALMLLGVNSVQPSVIISTSGFANLSLKQETDATVLRYSSGSSQIILNTQVEGTKVFIVEGGTSNIRMYTEANQMLGGESVISLEGMTLKPGDELIINTCDMTVTINGQNAMEYFSNDSDFFTLLNGLNTLIYNDSNSSRNISFDVIWKDRWL
jgi:hypothetical protein